MTSQAEKTGCIWREEIDSLAFQPSGHAGLCVIHRLAFRTLLGREATAEDCLNYFARNWALFENAARTKIARAGIAATANFHLNSRDIARAENSSVSA